MKRLDQGSIHAVGVWALRVVLAAGGIICALYGKDEGVTLCILGLFMSFVLL